MLLSSQELEILRFIEHYVFYMIDEGEIIPETSALSEQSISPS